MKTGIRILAVMVALAVLATGPLAPLAAAQQPAAPPMPPMPPTQQPVAQPPQDIPEPESHLAESAAYNVGAGIANVFYIPGKGLLCGDRKSTRLNSSHRCISYAVFCLKKKKT